MGIAAFLPLVLLVVLSQTAIILGVFFISGQLLPQTLSALYAQVPSSVWRTVIASVFIFPLGNWMIAYAYGHFPPGIVAPMMVCALVLLNIGFTMLVIGAKISPALVLAILLMAAGGAWASLLLQQAK